MTNDQKKRIKPLLKKLVLEVRSELNENSPYRQMISDIESIDPELAKRYEILNKSLTSFAAKLDDILVDDYGEEFYKIYKPFLTKMDRYLKYQLKQKQSK